MSKPFSIAPRILKRIYESYISAADTADLNSMPEDKPLPDPVNSSQLRTFIEFAFWASLRHEEGRFHEFSLALLPKESPSTPFVFDDPIDFNDHNLSKLAPALDPLTSAMGVWPGDRGALKIWGFIRQGDTGINGMNLSATTVGPGEVLISFTQYEAMVFFTTLITGTRVEAVGRSNFLSWVVPESRTGRIERLELPVIRPALDYRTVAMAMRAHGHGGTLLIVREGSSWVESILQPMKFSGPPYHGVRYDIVRRNEAREEAKATGRIGWPESERYKMATEAANKSLRTIGRLTAVDGAAVVTYELDVLAFGVKIRPRRADEKPGRLLLSEPFVASRPHEIGLSDLGGTRHQSAAQFVFDQRDAIAFVASQDGRMSAMRWDPGAGMVSVIRPAEFALL